MKLFENYNNAKQKYGLEIVEKLSNLGIPSQYLLSACRFANEGIKPTDLKHYFKQWMNYVVSNDKTIDVNRLSFEEFYQTIQEYKSSYEVPNKIFDNGAIQIGEFKTFKEANMFPIPNDMCICKTKKWFKYYQSPHSRYLLIYDSRRNDDKRYVLAIIEYGDISYADLSGHEFANSYADQEKGNATQTEFDQYQQSIGKEAVAFLYNIAADVKDKIDNNNDIKTEHMMRNKRKYRLTENRLRGIVHEAVRRVLKEGTFDADEIDARLTDAFGDEAMLSKKSDDDMVTVITDPGTVDLHELNGIMIELGYMPYQKTRGYDAWTFINSKSADKYADGDILRQHYGFDF